MLKFKIIDNKKWLYDGTNFTETDFEKLFEEDVVDLAGNLISSDVRKKDLVGIFSTSQTQRYGKNKRGNIIYIVKPLDNKLPNFLIAYGGKLKGKIAVKFKFNNWDKKFYMKRIKTL